jgi:hypothetical protein
MIKYIHKSEDRTVVVKGDPITTHECLDLWLDFMRGLSFIISNEIQDRLHEALDSDSEGLLEELQTRTGYVDLDTVEADTDYEDASPTDAAEAQAEEVGVRSSYPIGGGKY